MRRSAGLAHMRETGFHSVMFCCRSRVSVVRVIPPSEFIETPPLPLRNSTLHTQPPKLLLCYYFEEKNYTRHLPALNLVSNHRILRLLCAWHLRALACVCARLDPRTCKNEMSREKFIRPKNTPLGNPWKYCSSAGGETVDNDPLASIWEKVTQLI